MGSSRGRAGSLEKKSPMADHVQRMESGDDSGPRMAGDILSGINPLEEQETSGESIMGMPDFFSPTKDSLQGGFLKEANPTRGGSYLGGARQSF